MNPASLLWLIVCDMPITNGVNRLLFGALTSADKGALRRKVALEPRRTRPAKVAVYHNGPARKRIKTGGMATDSDADHDIAMQNQDLADTDEMEAAKSMVQLLGKRDRADEENDDGDDEGEQEDEKDDDVVMADNNTNNNKPVDDPNEDTMVERIKLRYKYPFGPSQDERLNEAIDCRKLKLSTAELADIYKQVNNRKPPPNSDRNWFCQFLTPTALNDRDPDRRTSNRAFARAIRERKVGKFVTWVDKFPDPFFSDPEHRQPRSSEQFLEAIKDSMLSSPEMSKLLELPSAQDLHDMCNSFEVASGDKARLTAYQNFVRNYMTPYLPRSGKGNPLGGLLLWHSVGAGKTCSYIAAASSSFELDNWQIVLSTPSASSTEFLKNVYDTVCHVGFAEHLATMPQSERDKFKSMSEKEKSEFFSKRYGNNKCAWMSEMAGHERKEQQSAPMQGWTHKRVANYLTGGSNSAADVKMLRQCQQRQNKQNKDPLFKTLFIIDEAHNFFNNEFYQGGRFNASKYNQMIQLIQNSRKLSKEFSVRFVLATATPQNPHPANLFRMLNMMTNKSTSLLPVTDEAYAEWVEQLPNDFADWTQAMRSQDGRNLPANVKPLYNFFLVSRGLISYVDVTDDISHFPHKVSDRRVIVRLTEHQAKAVMGCVKKNSKAGGQGGGLGSKKKAGGGGGGAKGESRLAECVKQASNFADSDMTKYHFDSPDFDPQALRDEMPLISEKMVMLLNQIDQHDADDREDAETRGVRARPYKHVIYTRTAKDARMLLSCFLADGDYENAIHVDKHQKLAIRHNVGGAYNIGLLSEDVEMWGVKQTLKVRRNIQAAFNSPKNAHGAIMRFIIIDQTMQEAIDLLNVRHLHIFEPTHTDVVMRQLIAQSQPIDVWDDSVSKQVIGRVSRYCGSKKLEFDDTISPDGRPFGWKLTVDRYYEVLDKEDRKALGNVRSPMELLINSGAIDLDYLKRLGNQVKVRNLAIMSAVDRLVWTVSRSTADYSDPDPMRAIAQQLQDGESSLPPRTPEERGDIVSPGVDATEEVFIHKTAKNRGAQNKEVWEQDDDEDEDGQATDDEEADAKERDRESNIY
jgi:hypothetical protein